jgi:hypothetical protein
MSRIALETDNLLADISRQLPAEFKSYANELADAIRCSQSKGWATNRIDAGEYVLALHLVGDQIRLMCYNKQYEWQWQFCVDKEHVIARST